MLLMFRSSILPSLCNYYGLTNRTQIQFHGGKGESSLQQPTIHELQSFLSNTSRGCSRVLWKFKKNTHLSCMNLEEIRHILHVTPSSGYNYMNLATPAK